MIVAFYFFLRIQ